MRNIDWTPKSLRAFKRLVHQNPQLRPLIDQTLHQLAEDPFQFSLRTHKLTKELSSVWARSIDYILRILFEFVKNPGGDEAILLLNLGSHNEVY